jgi:hypothetical protein
MPPRRLKAKRSGGWDAPIGILLGIVGLAMLGALGGAAWWAMKNTPQIDKDTNCPKSGPTLVHLVVFDQSDPVSGQQAQRIKFAINELKRSATFGYRFDVYTFNGDIKNVLSPVLQICSPGRPEEANELYQNPEMIRRQYDERFSSVLDKTVDSLLRETRRDNSPIIESIKAASLSSFGGLPDGRTKLRVTLISDMIQHTPATSHFRGEPNFPQLMRTAAWSQLQPDLKKAEVQILYLLRPEAKRAGVPIQNRGHQAFWEQLIERANGVITKIDPI